MLEWYIYINVYVYTECLCNFSQIPGGKREQTGYVHGVIFKKNIAHKKMSHHLNNPRTLLMNGSIEYQRVENKMSSLQPQILQVWLLTSEPRYIISYIFAQCSLVTVLLSD